METILRLTFGSMGEGRRETLLEECRQRVSAVGSRGVVLNEVRGEVLGDQLRVMRFEHFTEKVQDEFLVGFELLVFTLHQSLGVVDAGDGRLREKRYAGDQCCQE